MRKIYTIGETVLDIIIRDADQVTIKPGGSMLNTAISLGRLGLPVNHITTMANDKTGFFLRGFLNQNGVKGDFIRTIEKAKTNLALAYLDEQYNADYTFYKDKLAHQPTLKFPTVNSSDVILFGSFFCLNTNIRPQLLSFLNAAKQKGATLIYDPNFRKPHAHQLNQLKPFIDENIEVSTIIKASNEDLSLIYGLKNGEESFNYLSNKGKKWLFYTKGKEGAEFYNDNGSIKKTAPNISLMSTIGAGDTFSAGLIYGMWLNKQPKLDDLELTNWETMLDFGIEFSAQVCQSLDNYLSNDFIKRNSYHV